MKTTELRDAFSCMAASVAVLTAGERGSARGVTLTSFVGLSLSPALAAFACNGESRMLSSLEEGDAVGVTMLAQEQEDLARECASPERGTLAESSLTRDGHGVPFVYGGIARFSLRLAQRHRVGDHMLVIAHVVEAGWTPGIPLVYHQRGYHSVSRRWPQGDHV